MSDQVRVDCGGWISGPAKDVRIEGNTFDDQPAGEPRLRYAKDPAFNGEQPNPNAKVQKWADVAMWAAPKHDDPQTPKVTISMCTPDPLGVMAMVNGQYTGKVYTRPDQVTDDERREAWEAATVSRLSETPLEWIQLSIAFENVSRAFTHQLVRTRMATYAQESMRFAVKEDMADAVKLPPSLAGTIPSIEFDEMMEAQGLDPEKNESREQAWRNKWDSAIMLIDNYYKWLIESGMPAEDARGLLPTNILTRVHMRVDMKSLLHMAGLRLCTQAQFEWRGVFAKLAEALRMYGIEQGGDMNWQMALMAQRFRPVCYTAGHCTMKARSDRHCSIREKVDTFADLGIPSSDWENTARYPQTAIRPEEWLADPTAARVAP